MNEEQQILYYLNRNHQVFIFENRFVDANGSCIWGEDVCHDLHTIFSIDLLVCENILKQWAIAHGLLESKIQSAWYKLRFTPISFNTHFEPQKKNRFVLEFPEYFNIASYFVTLTSRPSIKFDDKKFLGFIYSRKIEWLPLTIKMLDPIGQSSSQGLMNVINNHFNEYFNVTIKMLDPTGETIEEWKIKDCLIKSIDFGILDYNDDGLADCILVLQPTSVELI